MDHNLIEAVQHARLLTHQHDVIAACPADGSVVAVLPRQVVELRLGTPLALAAWMRRHARPEVAWTVVSEAGVQCIAEPDDAEAHTASARLTVHPRLQPWLQALGKRLSQREVAALARGQRALVEGDGGQASPSYLQLAQAMHSLAVRRDTKVEQHIDQATGRTTLSAASAGTTVEVAVPPVVEIIAPWYVGVQLPTEQGPAEPQYRLHLTVEVDVDEAGRAVIVLGCPLLEVQRLRALEDVAGCIRWAAQLAGCAPPLVELGSVDIEQSLALDVRGRSRRVLIHGRRDVGPLDGTAAASLWPVARSTVARGRDVGPLDGTAAALAVLTDVRAVDDADEAVTP